METVTRLDVLPADGKPLSAQVSNDLAFYKSFGSPGHVTDSGLTVPPVDSRGPHEKNHTERPSVGGRPALRRLSVPPD